MVHAEGFRIGNAEIQQINNSGILQEMKGDFSAKADSRSSQYNGQLTRNLENQGVLPKVMLDGLDKSAQGCRTDAGKCDESVVNWKPDSERKTESARQWDRDARKQDQTPVELNKEGKYEVKRGDSLSGIAERALKQQGKTASQKEINMMVDEIVRVNKSKYPELDCNKHLICIGMTLDIPNESKAGTGDGSLTAKEMPKQKEETLGTTDTARTKEETLGTTDTAKSKEETLGTTDTAKSKEEAWVATDTAKSKEEAWVATDTASARPDSFETSLNGFEHARKLEMARFPEKFVPNQPDGSMQLTTEKAKVTYWKDGSMKVEGQGSGYAFKRDEHGGYEYTRWSNTDRNQNYRVHYDKQKETLTEVSEDAVKTMWKDGAVRVERRDRTGYSVKPNGSGEFVYESWGPKDTDNRRPEVIQKSDPRLKKLQVAQR